MIVTLTIITEFDTGALGNLMASERVKTGYTTVMFYQTDDRYILDIKNWSFSFWKKTKFWVWLWLDRTRRDHFQIGPIEVFRHIYYGK